MVDQNRSTINFLIAVLLLVLVCVRLRKRLHVGMLASVREGG